MSVIDIRIEEQEVSEIRFAEDNCGGFRQVCRLVEGSPDTFSQSFMLIREGEGGEFVRVHGKQHAVNMIFALKKSIELGWLD